MSLKKYLAVAAVSVSLGLGATSLRAQGIITGSVTGTVQDQTGAVVPGATITAHNIALGQDFTATAAANGEFQLGSLPIGEYALTISRSGFADTKIGHVIVETGKATGLGIEKLGIGATEIVEVSTAQNMLETVQSQVTTTFDSEQIQNLPTGGGFDELALLIPGVVSTHADNKSNTNGAGISSNGQRGRSNNFEVDGQANNDSTIAGPSAFLGNPDALQEIQIITNNFSAQYGRDAGSVVNYITKSGTNQFHGTAFEYYEGSWLTSLTQAQKGPQFGFCTQAQQASGSTATCTVPHKPRFTDNSFGGSFGGPILRDRLFGFGSALFARNYSGQSILTSGTVGATTGYTPTPDGVKALVAAFPTNPGIQSLARFGPYAAIYAGGAVSQIPGSTQTVPISDGTTTINVPVSLYQRNVSPHSTDEELLGRLDYQATSKDRFFLRYFYQKDPSLPYNATVTGGIVNVNGITHSVGADWTHTFGARFVNQVRYSFQQSRLTFDGGAFSGCTVSALQNCPSQFTISSTAASRLQNGGINPISSFGLSSSYPQGRIIKDTQVQDNFSINVGRHTITLGGQFEYQNSPNTFLPSVSGAFAVTTGTNGFLAGNTNLSLAVGNANIKFTEPDYAAYFQDDWKVTSALTLNLGVRWEFFSQSSNLLHNLSLANQTGPTPLWNPSLPQNTTATQSGTVFPYVPNDYKHFEPRIGFAYNPSGLKSMVLRGGYSINIAPAYLNIALNSNGYAPLILSGTITGCNNTTKPCIPQGGATYTTVHALDNPLLIGTGGATGYNPGNFNQSLIANNFRQPITQTYTLGVQQQVGRIAVVEIRYTGAHTTADFQTSNENPYFANAAAAFPSFFAGITPCAASTLAASPNPGIDVGRLHCGQGLVRLRANTSFEIYNGLQTSLKTRNYHGLTANLGYTFSRTIDNASEVYGATGSGQSVSYSQNPLDTNVGERGVSGNSYPNVTSLGLTYVDPHFKQNHSLVGKLLGGFQFNTIYLFNSGQPFTPFQLASENSFCDSTFNNSAFGGTLDSCRPILANAAAPLGNVGVFVPTTIVNGTPVAAHYADYYSGATVARSSRHFLINNQAEAINLGNPYPGVGRNTLRGGSYNNMDASIYKNNKITERINLQLQATFFNALNRAYYGSPDSEIEDSGYTNATFGNFIGNGGSNRNVQIGARLLF